jgi:hypothetical protein
MADWGGPEESGAEAGGWGCESISKYKVLAGDRMSGCRASSEVIVGMMKVYL